MSTKEQPGPFDAFAKLAPDEPYFVLRAKDISAPATIEAWVRFRRGSPSKAAKADEAARLTEALACAAQMRDWYARKMNGQPCGCDPGENHHCSTWPECAFGRMKT